jgi:ParB-like chromosome segregation protein Spo0J
MNTEIVKIEKVLPNTSNPRIIKDDKFKKLVKSIQEFPEMLNLRPIVVDADMVVLGGNMRLKACKAAGLTEVPIVIADQLTPEQQAEFIIKDNVGFGEWDWDLLANEWEPESLIDWGLSVPYFLEDTLTNNQDYEGLDQLSKLDKFMDSELKRMFLVYDAETFAKVVKWFERLQEKHGLGSSSDVILKLMEDESF